MNAIVAAAAKLLREVLARDIATANDAVSLVVTGETLRRVASHDPVTRAQVEPLLSEYDHALATHAALVPHDLDADLDAALDLMRRAAEYPSVTDPDDVLRGVDEVLMVAAAAHRAGRLGREAVEKLGERALQVSRTVAVDADALWAEANDRAGRIGPDPDMPGLCDWLEPLASFAPARVAALVAARRGSEAARRARAIETVLARRAMQAARDDTPAPAGWAVDWLKPFEKLWPELDRPPQILPSAGRVALAAAAAPAKGSVPIVVAVPGGAARVLTLSVELAPQPGDAFAKAVVLGPDARDAVVSAFVAATALTRMRLPPAMLEQHRVSISGDVDDLVSLDGGSLGAAAAAAFLSLWSDRAAGPGVISAELPGFDVAGKLRQVEHAEAKAAAVGAFGKTLWLATGTPAGGASNVQYAETLADALRGLGLIREEEREGVEVPVDLDRWATLELEQAISRTAEAVDYQQLAEAESWDTVAARLVVLAAALERGAPTAPKIAHGRAAAALALLHAARTREAEALLKQLRGELESRPLLAAYLEVVDAASLTDRLGPWDADVGRAVERLQAIARRWRDAQVGSLEARTRCLALGTEGRLYLHRGASGTDLERARGLLSQAMDEWAQLGFPHEVPRSATYLANCLRLLGRPRDALAVLEGAIKGLEQVRSFLPAYERSTSVFVMYEVMRALREAKELDAAIDVGRRALEAARLRRALAVWPRLGIARSIVAALVARGRAEDMTEKDAQVAEILSEFGADTNPVLVAVCQDATRGQDTTVY